MNCYICKNKVLDIDSYLEDDLYPTNSIQWKYLDIYCCKNCGIGFVPNLKKTELDDYYLNYYRGSYDSVKYDTKIKIFNKNFISPLHYSQAITLSLNHNNLPINKKFLDIGCGGDGVSFTAFDKVLKNVSFSAIEPDKFARKKLEYNNVNIIGSDWRDLKNCKSKFDIVLMSHVLEHLPIEDIPDCLLLIRKNLTSNCGALIIDVPHNDVRWMDRQYHFSMPHITFFSLKSLKRLIESAGFKIIYSNATSMDHDAWVRVQKNKENKKKSISNILKYIKKIIPYKVLDLLYKNKSLKQMFNNKHFIANQKGLNLRIIALIN